MTFVLRRYVSSCRQFHYFPSSRLKIDVVPVQMFVLFFSVFCFWFLVFLVLFYRNYGNETTKAQTNVISVGVICFWDVVNKRPATVVNPSMDQGMIPSREFTLAHFHEF